MGDCRSTDSSSPVTVTRDAHGVPTIEAANLEDLFFAQGFVTAQDRMWQMDMMRRFGSGELSEILGDLPLKLDREQRILGLRAAAKKSLTMASPRDRSYYEAYARGVNAYIAKHANALPVEFRILHYSPKPWLAEDSVVIANSMVKDLNYHYFFDALDREKILAKLGPELTNDLYVNRSWHDRPPTVMREDLNEPDNNKGDSNDDDDEDDDAPDNSVTQLPAESLPVNGSNDWVVSGAHTVTGKPLLSNDMHLGHQMPNLWYEAHLHCGALDVAGVTLPGMPYVIVGHNQRIAWGFTNVGPTVTDVYIENFNPQGAYQTPDGWVQPEHRAEVIHVKGKPDVTVDVKITRHGPIITELVPGETRPLALRWTLYDGLRIPFFDVNTAQNWQEFRKAFSQLDAPGQNVVYADVDGNIGYQTTGKVPIRAAGDGSLPVSGADNAHEWVSYIPFEKLPSVYNPPSGIIATANGRITPDGYPNSISMEWEAPWRTERIYHVLESGRQFSPADMLALETDIHSEPDLFAAERFVYAVDHASKPSARAKEAVDLMRSWDGRMMASSAAPTIAENSIRELRRLVLEAKLGAAPGDSATGERDFELADLFVGDAFGLAGKHSAAPAQALAAGEISELRRIADRGGGSGGEWSGGAKGVGGVALGRVQCGRNRAPSTGKDSLDQTLGRARSERAIGQRLYGEGGNPAPRAIRAIHRESGEPGRVDAEHRHRPRWKFPEPVLHGSVEGVVRGNDVHTSVYRQGRGRGEDTSADAGALQVVGSHETL